ncbi:hypothetical protein NQZ79_g1920 [Umbelopsis isabellina]|nr:hypothetical protein NQZ79_g1920 [Umbelopsis isabellina]
MSEVKEQIQQFSSKAEDLLDTIGQPLKPYIPAISRFLIVATFLEDSLRIITQWGDQVFYMQNHRGFFWGLSHLFLAINVVLMIGGSSLVIIKKHQDLAAYALFAVVVLQAFGYGLVFNMSFFLRNLSVVGGLLMVLSDSYTKRKQMFAALPQMSETDRREYFQLAGRILLIFLFIGSAFHGDWTFGRVLVSLIGLAAAIMVIVGFKAKWSAIFLILFLSIFNVLINNFWATQHNHFQRDFLKYDFFQTLSTVGGFLLLVNIGPGGLSLDEKKKAF